MGIFLIMVVGISGRGGVEEVGDGCRSRAVVVVGVFFGDIGLVLGNMVI